MLESAQPTDETRSRADARELGHARALDDRAHAQADLVYRNIRVRPMTSANVAMIVAS